MRYDLNMMATITGLTTRTLRNYINMGLLQGEKIDYKSLNLTISSISFSLLILSTLFKV